MELNIVQPCDESDPVAVWLSIAVAAGIKLARMASGVTAMVMLWRAVCT